MKASNKLTELSVKSAKPADKLRKLTDGSGMYLLVHPNGSKYWRMDTRIEGKRKTFSFGVWPEVWPCLRACSQRLSSKAMRLKWSQAIGHHNTMEKDAKAVPPEGEGFTSRM